MNKTEQKKYKLYKEFQRTKEPATFKLLMKLGVKVKKMTLDATWQDTGLIPPFEPEYKGMVKLFNGDTFHAVGIYKTD